MPVTLKFYGGLFQEVPGSGPARRVEVYMRLPQGIEVKADGRRLTDLEALCSSAIRLDFEASNPLELGAGIPARPVSHILPIDYQGFRKTISFNGGTLVGSREPDRSAQLAGMLRLKGAKSQERCRAFQEFTGITGHPDEHIELLADEFFDRMGEDELRHWTPDYRLIVAATEVKVVVNGRPQSAEQIPDGTEVTFKVDLESTLPHFPSGNPHVLEHPPSI